MLALWCSAHLDLHAVCVWVEILECKAVKLVCESALHGSAYSFLSLHTKAGEIKLSKGWLLKIFMCLIIFGCLKPLISVEIGYELAFQASLLSALREITDHVFFLLLCSHSWLHSVVHQTLPSRWHGSTTASRVRPLYCSLRKHTQFRGIVTPGSFGYKWWPQYCATPSPS